MSISPRFVLVSISFLWLSLALPTAARADHVIDPFQNAFSPAVMWVGKDNSGNTKQSDQRNQATPNAVGGWRLANLTPSVMTNYVTTDIDTIYRKLRYRTRDPAASGMLELAYGTNADLNLDLSADHYFQITIAGLGYYKYLKVTIGVVCTSLTTGDPTYVTTSTPYSLPNGTSRIKFSDFVDCDFSDVSQIYYLFDASALTRASYDLTGGLRTVY